MEPTVGKNLLVFFPVALAPPPLNIQVAALVDLHSAALGVALDIARFVNPGDADPADPHIEVASSVLSSAIAGPENAEYVTPDVVPPAHAGY